MKILKQTIVKDCSFQFRVRYKINTPFIEDYLDFFPDARIQVNEFSAYVRDAKDHFTIETPRKFHISGLLGDATLTVTYEKSQKSNIEECILNFKNTLKMI